MTFEAGSGKPRAVGLWLLVCCAMIFAMALIGAITRLTESGLSIMEWAPLSGALPPMGQAEWQRLFALYQEIPEYQQENAGMSLAEFKTIFWWEYIHRLWGRLIGVVFALPFLWFLLRRQIPVGIAPHLVAIFALGGLQGFLGWFMVASGFAERTDVSQYRLTLHLLVAVLIYAYAFWIALRLLDPPGAAEGSPARESPGGHRRLSHALTGLGLLILLTIASGGLVAGLNAGLVYNSFPLMDGQWLPSDYGVHEPFALNFFENVAAVQFNHRLLAITTLAASLGVWLWSLRLPLATTARLPLVLLALTALLQVGLGIATLLLVVPLPLAVLHQGGAIVLLTAVLWALHRLVPGARLASQPQT